MASTGRNWAIGCGVALLIGLIALGGIGTCVYTNFRDLGGQVEEMETATADLAARFGPPESWTPDPGPELPFSRLATFVAVRESLLVAGEGLARQLRILDGSEPAGAMEKVRAGLGFVPAVIGYLAGRDAILLEQGLHPGAYLYLYSTAYLAWLGHDPGAGPDLDLQAHGDGEPGVHVELGNGDGHGDRASHELRVRRRLNDVLTPILENQLDELRARGRGNEDWATTLTEEIARLQADPHRYPWQDGLPDALAGSLAPHRAALVATWAPELNPLDLELVRDH